MNRRGFLSTLAAVAATAVLDPERLLWRPGAKAIFIPPAIKAPIVDEQYTFYALTLRPGETPLWTPTGPVACDVSVAVSETWEADNETRLGKLRDWINSLKTAPVQE